MRFSSCLSSDNVDRTRPEYSQVGQAPPHRSSPASPLIGAKVPGCIFCDVSKEKGFGVVYEDQELIAFYDRKPRARVHLLIIPRYHIDSVRSLTKADIPLLDRMASLATSLTDSQPSRQGFHIPPFSSVAHLHMHVLVYPLKGLGRVKYPVSSRMFGEGGKGWGWFAEVGQVRDVLERGGRVGLGRSG